MTHIIPALSPHEIVDPDFDDLFAPPVSFATESGWYGDADTVLRREEPAGWINARRTARDREMLRRIEQRRSLRF